MAWNDVYKNDNAVHLMITIGGYQYNFSTNGNGAVGTDIKVERKIGDTLSKFSLGIVDDGSDDYIQFERVVLNRFVSIEISYGNSTQSLLHFSGFVVDYQPVFFGSSSKLTITGYLTRKQKGLPDQTSPYLYYIDWVPVVGKRKDDTKDWDDIYNGSFSFQADSYGNELEDSPLISREEANAIIDERVTSQKNNFVNTNTTSLEARLLRILQDQNVIDQLDQGGILHRPFDDEGVYFQNITSVVIDIGVAYCYWDGETEETSFKEYADFSIYMLEESYDQWAIDVIGRDFYNDWKSFIDQYNDFDEVASRLELIAQNDTYADYIDSSYFEIGHVPWSYDMISNYGGNIVFSRYSHPNDSKRSIARVVPDIFIEWDKDLPMSSQYMDGDGQPYSGNYGIFPDWAINDIKVFGLQYEFSEADYTDNPGDPYSSFFLLETDMHGVRRIYRTNDKYYIWVGDIPQLYKLWKDSGWNYSNTTGYLLSERVTYITYEKGVNYKKWTYLRGDGKGNHYYGRAQRDFTSTNWDEDVNNGHIKTAEEFGYTSSSQTGFANTGEARKKYKITGTKKDDPIKGMIEISASDRIIQYLQAAYRSGEVLTYGVVYISDIVAQLCILEGWSNPEIAATTASSYRSDFLYMNGMSALEYISQQLCPNATESGGAGRTGFQCYFDTNGRFHFIPINVNHTNTVLQLGYNIKDSSVISFTVRSRGQVLMLGVDDSIENVNLVTGEYQSVTTDRNETVMSSTEAKLNEAAQGYTPTFSFITDTTARQEALAIYQEQTGEDARFFNRSLFNYYGYEPKVDEYLYFTSKLYNTGGVDESMAYGTSLIRRSYGSSASSTTQVYLDALQQLQHLEAISIQAEMTIIGDNEIAPGQYIKVVNYTRKGKHYTSGDYYIQQITDNVTASAGFTQNLKLWRYSNNVSSMVNPVSYKTISTTMSSRFEEALNYYLTYKDDKFFEWYDANFDVEGNYIYTSNFSSNEETANGNESTGGGGSGGGRF